MNNIKKLLFFAFGVAAFSSLLTVLLLRLPAHANVLDDFLDRLLGNRAEERTTLLESAHPYDSPLQYEEAIIKAVEGASPGVISIIVTKDLPVIERCPATPFGDLPPEFRDFFGPFGFDMPCERGTRTQEVGGGSGFIVSSDGLIVTNKHVVADRSASYTVLTNDGEQYSASILARDPVQDIAIVKIQPRKPLPVLTLGDSDSVKLGQTAIAIGNALGEFRNTVSVGIVSGLSRSIDAAGGSEAIEHLEGLIQTDAAINPGNSGGPLLNLKGEVIGINTAIAADAENIGFTIPINHAKRDIDSVIRTGKISVPFLGVRYGVITPAVAERENLPVKEGVLVQGSDEFPAVVPNSPAEKAGIREGDILTKINGEAITADTSLGALIQKYKVGDRAIITLLREGKQSAVSAVLAERSE